MLRKEFSSMSKLSSYCGIICDKCPIHLATIESNQSQKLNMRTEIAEIILKEYSLRLTANEITDCDGCKGMPERLFTLCQNCKIRKCAQQKDIDNCAECNEYACDSLMQLFLKEPEVKRRLDKIHSSG